MRRSILDKKQFLGLKCDELRQADTSILSGWTQTHRLKTKDSNERLHNAGACWLPCLWLLIHRVKLGLALEGANDNGYKSGQKAREKRNLLSRM